MTIGLLARIEAKPEFADQVAALLTNAAALAEQEPHTLTWYAFREGPTTFGIFDTFADEEGRQAHLQGRIAAALMDSAPTMLAGTPVITPVDVLATKSR